MTVPLSAALADRAAAKSTTATPTTATPTTATPTTATPTTATPTSKRPRVALVSDAIYPYHKGGKEMRCHQLAARLGAEGVEVHVFAMKWWDGPRHILRDGVHLHGICRSWPMYKGARRSIVQAVMFSIACLGLVRYRFDLIDADHMPYLQLFPLRLVATVKRVPLFVTWHEVWGRTYWRNYLGPAGILAAAIERAAMRIPDQIVADADETERRLLAEGVNRHDVAVVPVGIDTEAIDAAPASADVYDLLYVGRLISHKNIDMLIESIATLRSEGRDLTCAIVGTGPEDERLHGLVAESGLGDQISFLGMIEGHEVVYGLMKSAKLFVLPSTREGFGVAVLESVACGTPVVTMEHPDNLARLLIDPGVSGWRSAPDAASLARTVDLALRADVDMVAPAAAVRHHYAWSQITHQIALMYSVASGQVTL